MQDPRRSPTSVRIRVVVSSCLFCVLILGMHAAAATQQLTCSPGSLRFGTVALGQSETQLVRITNTGQTSATISAISVSLAQFRVSGITLPIVVGAGRSLDLNVTFSPAATGWLGAKILITSNASNPTLQLAAGGTGVTSDSLTASPTALSFGQVPIGSTASLTVTLTNARSYTENLRSALMAGSGFSVSSPVFP